MEIGEKRLWLFHGHQVSRLNWAYQTLGTLLLRWVLHPLGIRQLHGGAQQPQTLQRGAARLPVRPRPEDRGLHRPHPPAAVRIAAAPRRGQDRDRKPRPPLSRGNGNGKARTGAQAGRPRRRARRAAEPGPPGARGESLYHDGPLLPCLFNSGCGIGRHGVTAIEIDSRSARLVYWFDRRRSGKYIEAEGYQPEPLAGTDFFRVVLKEEDLNYIFTRINLLG